MTTYTVITADISWQLWSICRLWLIYTVYVLEDFKAGRLPNPGLTLVLTGFQDRDRHPPTDGHLPVDF